MQPLPTDTDRHYGSTCVCDLFFSFLFLTFFGNIQFPKQVLNRMCVCARFFVSWRATKNIQIVFIITKPLEYNTRLFNIFFYLFHFNLNVYIIIVC